MKRFSLLVVMMSLGALLFISCNQSSDTGVQAVQSNNTFFTDEIEESLTKVDISFDQIITLTKKEDMNRVYDVLKSIIMTDINMTFSEGPTGPLKTISMETKDGTLYSVTLTSDKILTGDGWHEPEQDYLPHESQPDRNVRWYATDQDYLLILRELFDEFSKVYEVSTE